MTRMQHFIVGLALVASPVFLLAQKQQRFVFVSAVDESGKPATDLKGTDFEVAEGGVKRPVVRADPGTTPMRIALLLDTGTAAEQAMSPLKNAVAAFLDAIPATDEVAIMSIGRQPRLRGRVTADKVRAKAEAKSLFTDGGATVMLDGMRDSYNQFMKQPEVRWPVWVIVTTDSTDGSAQMQANAYNNFVGELRMKGASVHAIVLQQNNMGSIVEFALNLTKNTGGMYDAISTATGLEDRLKKVAARIVEDHQKMANAYQVEFLSDPQPKGEIDVTMLRPGVKIAKVSVIRPF